MGGFKVNGFKNKKTGGKKTPLDPKAILKRYRADARANQKHEQKADEFFSYLQELANDFELAHMTCTAKDLHTAAKHIDSLLAAIEERDFLVDQLTRALAQKGGAR